MAWKMGLAVAGRKVGLGGPWGSIAEEYNTVSGEEREGLMAQGTSFIISSCFFAIC